VTPEILKDKLLASAQTLGWPVAIEPDFASPRFRGRQDPSAAPLPDTTFGLRLGAYPALVAPIALNSSEQMQTSLRTLHNQMVIGWRAPCPNHCAERITTPKLLVAGPTFSAYSLASIPFGKWIR
jgi:hypothetical protein